MLLRWWYQRGLVSMIYKFFDENTAGGDVKNEMMQKKYIYI